MSTRSTQDQAIIIRNQALAAYEAIKRGPESAQAALEFLEEAAKWVNDANANPLSCAYWLWIAGEYVNVTEDEAVVETNAGLIASCIDSIERSWKQPGPHWLKAGEHGRFLSNLAIYYAALRSINNSVQSDTAQRVCKEIREDVFAKFMYANSFVIIENSQKVWPDIVAAAVPFGLLSAGDLAMLEALKQLDDESIEGAEAALLAWYYCESGKYLQSEHYLQLAAEWDGRDDGAHSVMVEIAARLLARKRIGEHAADASSEGIIFQHDPVGSACPYLYFTNERDPRMVTVDDKISFKTFAEPFDSGHVVWLSYSDDGARFHSVRMQPLESPDGEAYWQAELPAWKERASVSYQFIAEHEGRQFYSDVNSFDVHQWQDVQTIIAAEVEEGKVRIQYSPLTPGGLHPVLTLTRQKDGATHYHIEMKDAATVQGELKPAQDVLAWAGRFLHMQLLLDSSGKAVKARLHFAMEVEERFYGMGERFARLTYTGFEVDNYVYNQYKDQGFRTYIPVPFTFSTSGFGLYLHSDFYSVFRFGTVRPDWLQLEADIHEQHPALEWYQFAGSPYEIIEQFTAVVGRPKLPPVWAFGPWMSSNNWDSEKETDHQLSQTVQHEIPATVMVLEQWSDEATFYIFNDAGYKKKDGLERFTYDDFTFPEWGRWPNPKKLVERIHDRGIKLLLWQAPVMKWMDGIAHAQRDEDEKRMIEQGYCVKNADGTPYRIPEFEWFRGSLVPDFTNPQATEWWLSKRQYLFDELGIDGFKTDGGECIYGSEIQFHDGRCGAQMRNRYPNVYVQAFHEFANRYVEGGAITFSRAGYTGAQSTPLHWAGDEKSTFEAFRSSIIAGLSSGMSGIPFWGWDLGGFSGEIPTAELYIRSAQMAAFCPVMQYHAESKGQFNLDRTPWNIAERTGQPEVITLYRKFANVRMNLLPYIYEQASVSAATGRPLMRAMVLEYPQDPACADLYLQYMFGEALLVAPVTVEGAEQVDVYLPEGRWLPLFGGAPQKGGCSITVAAELGDIPVFMKEDSVLPMNLGEDYLLPSAVGNRTDQYVHLSFMIYLTHHVEYRFTDDRGNSFSVSGKRENGRIVADMALAGDEAVTVIFRGIDQQATEVRLGGEALIRVEEFADLVGGSWLQRGDEILVRPKSVSNQSAGSFVIAFA